MMSDRFRSSPAQTASAESRPKLPAKTDSHRKSLRSSGASNSWLQSTAACIVLCRAGAVRLPSSSSRKRSRRRSIISNGDMTAARAAASSMASGMPSQVVAELRQSLGVIRCYLEAGSGPLSPVKKQFYGFVAGQVAGSERGSYIGHDQRWHAPVCLAGHS